MKKEPDFSTPDPDDASLTPVQRYKALATFLKKQLPPRDAIVVKGHPQYERDTSELPF